MSNEQNATPDPDFDTLFFGEQAGEQVEEVKVDAPGEKEDAPVNEGGEEAAGAGDGAGETPVEQPAAETPPVEDWAAKYKELEDRYGALHGRLAPTQRQLSELQARLNAFEQQQQDSRARPATAAQQEADTDSFFDSDEEFRRWADAFPGDAKILRGAVEAERKAARQAIDQLNEQVTQLAARLDKTEQVTTRATVNEELRMLEERHPDWAEHNQSDEFWDWFDDWRSKQPKSLRALYDDEERVKAMLNDAEFVADRLDDYKATRKPTTNTAPVTPEPPKPQVDSTQTQPEVDPNLELSVAPDVKGRGQVRGGVPMASLTEAEQFEALMRQADPTYQTR